MNTPIAKIRQNPQAASTVSLTERVDALRRTANTTLDEDRRAALGQYMTPAQVARLMASMFGNICEDVHLLDAGAGIGSLTASFVEEACLRPHKPKSITVSAYETEAKLAKKFARTAKLCREACAKNGISFAENIYEDNFIEQATAILAGDLFSKRIYPRFNRAIINPPYRKIHSSSKERKLLRDVGIETSNLYTAFVALAIRLLEDDGEIVAITPRSFCNGPYFKPFRKLLLNTMCLKHIHIFHARDKAFKEDSVLQENIIFHAKKCRAVDQIIISSNTCAEDTNIVRRSAPFREVINPDDPDLIIHIATTHAEGETALKARSLPCSLDDLGLEVSTGRVVDFRAKEYLHIKPHRHTAPLIYPVHFANGFVSWPKSKSRKPNSLDDNADTASLLVPSSTYVLVKRFTAKEERRRVVAAVFDPQRIKTKRVGFENHLNYYHVNGDGIAPSIARGLALFLNSSLIDQYFRQFSGHTQVNATDLRSLRYPTLAQLKRIGSRYRKKLPDQERIDAILAEVLRG